MEKKISVTSIKGKPIKEYNHEYWQNYKSKNKRIVLTIPNQMYGELKQKAKEIKKSVPEFIKLKLDNQIHKGTPPELKEQLREISFLLRNATNNINQIAYNLNLEALETGNVDLTQSQIILLNIYSGIEKLENLIISYVQEKSHDSKVNEPKESDI